MMTARRLAFVLFAALASPLFYAASMAQNCCTHEGQNVQCPAGLPPGSGSVKYVPGGTDWAVPGRGTVFVPQTSFPACTPSQPNAPSATPPTTPSTTPPTAKPTTPPSTTPSTTPAPSGTTTPSAKPTTQPGDAPSSAPRYPVPNIQGPQENVLEAKPLNQPDSAVGAVPPKPDDAKAVDQSIERLKKLRESEKPQVAKAPPASACGPDVTDYVLGVLQMIQDTYKSWSDAERSKRCGSLYGLGFRAAWDLQGFTPSDGEDYMPEIFFQRAAPNYCAIPKDRCGATVAFFGYCVHAQVVNYVQWGLMNELCGTQVKGRIARSTRSVFSDYSAGQEVMSDLGADFNGSLDLETKKRILKDIMDTLVRRNQDDWYKMTGTDCALVCDQSAAQPWLENFSWGFQWGSDDEPPETKRGSELKKP